MRILQISDLHLVNREQKTKEGINTLFALERLLHYLKNQSADLLVVTGDIAYDSEDSWSYRFLKKVLSELPYEWVVLPGNYDRGGLFKEIFGAQVPQGFEVRFAGRDKAVLFFDTSSVEAIEQDLVRLEQHLVNSEGMQILFTHYPPISVGHAGYDGKHALLWRERLLNTLKKSIGPLHCFFGHIHFEFEQVVDQLHFYSVPSATLPLKPGFGKDELDTRGLFYRSVQIRSQGCETTVHCIPN